MQIKAIIAASVSVFILSGCQTNPSFERDQEIIGGSPAVKRRAVQNCYETAKKKSKSSKIAVAEAMNVSPKSNVDMIFCTRLIDAIASKKITYSDLNSGSPAFIRAMQAR
jgi:hypothetical protein